MGLQPCKGGLEKGLAPPERRHRGRAGGMTVVEVLIAATLLAFVVLGALGAISQSVRHANHARMVTLASQVLQSTVEDLRLKNYADISTYAAQAQPVDFSASIASNQLSSNFTSGMTVSATFATAYPSGGTQLGLVTVDLTVAWTEGGQTYRRSAVTHFGEKGLSDYIYVGF